MSHQTEVNEDIELLEKDSKYCSFADTAHYAKTPKVFKACEGSYMYDSEDTPYLDLQMYFSAANFGYKNQRIIDAVIDQMNKTLNATDFSHSKAVTTAKQLQQLPFHQTSNIVKTTDTSATEQILFHSRIVSDVLTIKNVTAVIFIV